MKNIKTITLLVLILFFTCVHVVGQNQIPAEFGGLCSFCDTLLPTKEMEIFCPNTTELDGATGSKVIDLRGLASGIYVYTIRYEKYTETGKLVITK